VSEPHDHPYAALTPDVVIDALAELGLPVDGRLMALSSYENRVYQVMLDDGQALVAKFYRPGRWREAQILEEHAFTQDLIDDEVPVVGPLTLHGRTLHQAHGFAFSVCPRRGGRSPELDDWEVLAWLGRFIARLHAVGERAPFVHRPALTPQTFGHEQRDGLLQSDVLSPTWRHAWQAACDEALALVDQAFHDTPHAVLRLHGDCHPGNVLWTPVDQPQGGPHFVDLDDARTGPAVQDLWMLLSGERASQTQQLAALLDGYEQMRPFDRRELQLIEPLRTLRMLHYSAWLARRRDDPAFVQSFPWFGSDDYWAGQTHSLREQCEAMQAPPLVA
jgi:Ser/Thr protein kinase RdoA (MazF antagonist)